MQLRRLLGLIALLAACKSGGIPDNARTTVLSFPDLDCADCGEEMARRLIQSDGVHKTGFNRRLAELTVVADPEIDVMALAQEKKPPDEEWHLVAGAGKGAYLPWQEPPSEADVVEVAHDGEDVPDLTTHLVAGKVTLVDFSAKWCDPCRDLDAHVLELMTKRDDIAYRKLDVGDWDTPLGKRYLAGVKELPYVVVYGPDKQRVEAITGFHPARLDAAIDKAAAKR